MTGVWLFWGAVAGVIVATVTFRRGRRKADNPLYRVVGRTEVDRRTETTDKDRWFI